MREWIEQALCREVGFAFFFPELGEVSTEAKATCARCPVRIDCLAEGIEYADQYGIRAGFNMLEIHQVALANQGFDNARRIAELMVRRQDAAANRSADLPRRERDLISLPLAG